MALKFNCPKCANEVEFKFLMAGETGQCPKCGKDIVIPADASQIGEGPSEIAQDIAQKIAAKNIINPKEEFLRLSMVVGVVHFLFVLALGSYKMSSPLGVEHMPIIVLILDFILYLPGYCCMLLFGLLGLGLNGFVMYIISGVTYGLLGGYLLFRWMNRPTRG
ncbi:MAG: hypothetical protein WC980_07645 [Candidatus Brocadiia bacterium]